MQRKHASLAKRIAPWRVGGADACLTAPERLFVSLTISVSSSVTVYQTAQEGWVMKRGTVLPDRCLPSADMKKILAYRWAGGRQRTARLPLTLTPLPRAASLGTLGYVISSGRSRYSFYRLRVAVRQHINASCCCAHLARGTFHSRRHAVRLASTDASSVPLYGSLSAPNGAVAVRGLLRRPGLHRRGRTADG